MRNPSVLVATLVAVSALLALPAKAQQFLVTPEEIGVGPPPAR
jgi:hypothetical protein